MSFAGVDPLGHGRAVDLEWGYFRRMCEGLLDHDDGVGGRGTYLSGQRSTAADHLAELAPLRTWERIPIGGYTGDEEQLWRIMKLYGLSRVSGYLIEQFCPQGEPGGTGAVTTGGLTGGGVAVHTEFLSGIGLTPFEHAESFSPFHHEIFAVVQDPSATTVIVEQVLWPGFWFGDLLFNRAGVRVRAPQHLVDTTVVTTSTLHFTFGRQQCPDPRSVARLGFQLTTANLGVVGRAQRCERALGQAARPTACRMGSPRHRRRGSRPSLPLAS
jgi:hypothetical protein